MHVGIVSSGEFWGIKEGSEPAKAVIHGLGRVNVKFQLHCESKRTSVLLSITLANINRFSNFFTVEFGNKFAVKFLFLLHCSPHLKRVAVLTCELKIVNFVILQAQ